MSDQEPLPNCLIKQQQEVDSCVYFHILYSPENTVEITCISDNMLQIFCIVNVLEYLRLQINCM